MTVSDRPAIGSLRLHGPAYALLLMVAAGCQPNTPVDAGPTYSPQGLAREFSFRMQAVAKGIPGASTGGAAKKSGDGRTAEQQSEELLFQDMITKLRTIKSKPIEQSCEDLIGEFSKNPDLTDEQKSRASERLRELAKEPS